MTGEFDHEILETLARIEVHLVEIATRLRETGDVAAKATVTFGETLVQLEKEGKWPSYDA